jgi:hypothetical protein
MFPSLPYLSYAKIKFPFTIKAEDIARIELWQLPKWQPGFKFPCGPLRLGATLPMRDGLIEQTH